MTTAPQYLDVSVKDIVTRAGDNVRSGELPEIEALATSIKEYGVLEPILVTPSAETPGKYTVIAGHRRLLAVRSNGGTTIPARVLTADAAQRLRIALVENIQREDMNPLDKARGVKKLLETTKLTQTEAAQALGVAPGFISQYLAITELPDAATAALRDGGLTFTHARALCRLLPNKDVIEQILPTVSELTSSTLDAKISTLLDKVKNSAPEEDAAEDDAEPAPKKARKQASAAKDKDSDALAYYAEAEFHPKKKEEIRALMLEYKRKELNSESEEKRAEYKLILKGITLAAALRLK